MIEAQLDLFAPSNPRDEVLDQLCAALPDLPPMVRYYDEFEDETKSIRALADQQKINLSLLGRNVFLDVSQLGASHSTVFKHLFVYMLGLDLSVLSIANYFSSIHHFLPTDIPSAVDAGPHKIGELWIILRARELPISAFILVKHLLHLLCSHRLNGWSSDYKDFLSHTLPLPARDKYAGVRSGDVFLSADEESIIIRHLDQVVEHLVNRQPTQINHGKVVDAGMLLCAYQFGMRPFQIAMVESRHVRIWEDTATSGLSIHVTFHMGKQHSQSKRKAFTRKVKNEWVPIFSYLVANLAPEKRRRVFPVSSNLEVGRRISVLVRDLLGSDDLGTATDLRHTAAQRMVDAGASHEELAEFLGHAQVTTGLVYYAASASQAERINIALGASDVYRRVAKIAHDRFISSDELAQLKDEQQIAAVPHGIPIAGIGGCASGQPACPYNPITSCYGCRKFMPINDKVTHERVLFDMREIVLFFESSSRGDSKSPTYMQLHRTIGEIQTVIAELEKGAQ